LKTEAAVIFLFF